MPFALVHHPDYVAPLPAGSSFPMNKYGLLLTARAAASDGLFYDPTHDRYHVFEQYNECVVGHPGCRGGWCVHTSVLLALKA